MRANILIFNDVVHSVVDDVSVHVFIGVSVRAIAKQHLYYTDP